MTRVPGIVNLTGILAPQQRILLRSPAPTMPSAADSFAADAGAVLRLDTFRGMRWHDRHKRDLAESSSSGSFDGVCAALRRAASGLLP